ncbi:MAG: nickel pincer cofactor biosynthesis protein LarB [Pirellulales bacterium]|nr:nickel pincer cofactor biosynthesis protein LarB [Pirellulales bacterium]
MSMPPPPSSAELNHWIERFQRGELSAAALLAELTRAQTANLEHTQVDLDRQRRCGYPEVVYSPGKSDWALIQIAEALLAQRQRVLMTRITPEQAAAVTAAFPAARHNAVGRTLRIDPGATLESTGENNNATGRVCVVTAGTTDLPVAEEARDTAAWMGCETTLFSDIGVAGPQRLISRLADIQTADAVVVAAGMEGALPSVVGGYVRCPVIAVPTSVGYGAAFGGLAALLGMLNSCAANVTVVNIDAGFKAGYIAGLIARRSL